MTEETQDGPSWRIGVQTTNALPDEDATWSFQLHGSVAVAAESAPATGLEEGLSPWPRGEDRSAARARALAWKVDFEHLSLEILAPK